MAEKEYIEREIFYKTMLKRFGCVPVLTDHSSTLRNDIHLDEALNSIPAANVVEVRHGEWITKGENGLLICSECGTNRPFDVQGDKIEYWQGNFCNICGAKMDGERKEQK